MSAASAATLDYSARMDQDRSWALAEGSRHFDGDSAVFAALHALARRLDELRVPYAVAGGMALFRHGFRRFTEDVVVLVTSAGLATLHAGLVGLGYLPTRPGGRNLRDAANGVRIEFLLTGAFPGDGKPKAVAFPDPADVAETDGGVRYLPLPMLVQLKLASGLSHAGRLKDLADVQELARARRLGPEFATLLHPSVRAKFLELRAAAENAAADDGLPA